MKLSTIQSTSKYGTIFLVLVVIETLGLLSIAIAVLGSILDFTLHEALVFFYFFEMEIE
mgnify:CR=1 FL=1